jgi:hypothetical protein
MEATVKTMNTEQQRLDAARNAATDDKCAWHDNSCL